MCNISAWYSLVIDGMVEDCVEYSIVNRKKLSKWKEIKFLEITYKLSVDLAGDIARSDLPKTIGE